MVLVRGPHKVDGGWPLVKHLARVAVVDEHGSTLIDELVRPGAPVMDYNTQYSGITAEMLKQAVLTQAEARAAVLRLIAGGAILVGHSLENDLRALRLAHTRVIGRLAIPPICLF